MTTLITGGAGYIGATIASALSDAGLEVVILDDLSKGRREFATRFPFYEGDIADTALIEQILDEHPSIDSVIHCAAKIVVPESVSDPLSYYENNVAKPIELLRTLARRGVSRFILSSTASMYVAAEGEFFVDESDALAPNSPYAASKMLLERIMQDFAATGQMQCLALRYFNPIGADPKLRTGQHDTAPTHVIGKMVEAYRAGGTFTLTGAEWPTRDGSALRDYIHVWDLAQAHVGAIQHFAEVMADTDAAVAAGDRAAHPNYAVINIGTGTGTTVFELVAAFNEAMGGQLPVAIAPPRPGDVVGCATRIDKARRLLQWEPQHSIAAGIRDSVAWTEKYLAELSAAGEL